MNRITAALYRFLVVYLSVAMVVTSIPLAPSTAYADDIEALAVENEAQETDSDSDADAKASYSASSSDGGSSSRLPTKRITLRTNRPALIPALPRRAWPKIFRAPRPIPMQQRPRLQRRSPRPTTAKSMPSCARTLWSVSMPSLCRTTMCIRVMLAEALR